MAARVSVSAAPHLSEICPPAHSVHRHIQQRCADADDVRHPRPSALRQLLPAAPSSELGSDVKPSVEHADIEADQRLELKLRLAPRDSDGNSTALRPVWW